MVHERRHVGDEPTKRPASDMDLGSIRLLKSSGPANGLTTARVTETGHSRVLVQRELVKAERGADGVQRLITTRTTRSEGVERPFTIRDRYDVSSLKVREEQTFINNKVGAIPRSRNKSDTGSRVGIVGVLGLTSNNKLILEGVLWYKNRGNRVLRILWRVLAGAVQNLVCLGQVDFGLKIGRAHV